MITSIHPSVSLRFNHTLVVAPIKRMIIHREVYAWPGIPSWEFTGSIPTYDWARHYACVSGHVLVLSCGNIFMSLTEGGSKADIPCDLRLLPVEESECFRAAVRQVVVAPRFDAPRRTNRTSAIKEWKKTRMEWDLVFMNYREPTNAK